MHKCNQQACKGALYTCEEMQYATQTKIKIYTRCPYHRAILQKHENKHREKRNKLKREVYNPKIAEQARRRLSQELKQAMAEREDVDVPEFTRNQLGVIVLRKVQLFKEVLATATFVYPYTTSERRAERNEEAFTVFQSRATRTPPLQRKLRDGVLGDLSHADIQSLGPWTIIDVFGNSAGDKNDGFNHWAVAEVEALLHIKLWKHPSRAWKKVGGDHAKGRERTDGLVDVSRRCTRLLISNTPVDVDRFHWNVDRLKPCRQEWSTRVQG